MKQLLIEVQSVKKHYITPAGRSFWRPWIKEAGHTKEALKGVSLDVREGEILGLLGVNGAGKTTLSTILAGLHPPTSGDVRYLGRSIYEDIVGYRKIVGFCPQKPNLDLSMTLEENLTFAGRYRGMSAGETRSRVESLVEQFQLGEYSQSKAFVLSGGYRQRFLIARTLVHRPKIIILDEPTVGLDPHIRRQLWEEIAALKKSGVSILLTTHYLDEAEYLSDRVCIIDDGSVKTIDTPQNLIELHREKRLEDVFLKLMQGGTHVEA